MNEINETVEVIEVVEVVDAIEDGVEVVDDFAAAMFEMAKADNFAYRVFGAWKND